MRRPSAAGIFVTGASGLLGRALVRRWRERRVRLFVLRHRRQVSGSAYTVVPGDLTVPRLGLSPAGYRELANATTAILHCAAITNFDRPFADARRVNVEGTRRLLRFARACPRLERIAVLSTAYVAGRRTGRVREDELVHRRGFVNTYERSKYEMERLLRSAMPAVPIAVYRLSTIIGHDRSGRVEQFGAFHHALRLYSRGLIPIVPGDPDAPVDLISSEYAEGAVFHLFQHAFEPGATYHIVAGERCTISLAELLHVAGLVFASVDRDWRRRAVTPPPIVSLDTFRQLRDATTRTENPFLAGILASMDAFAPQLCYPKVFDATRAGDVLGSAGIHPSQDRELLDRVLRFCLRSRWGAQRE